MRSMCASDQQIDLTLRPHIRDSVYLFSCHLEWHSHGNIRAYEELVAALDDPSQQIRKLAEALLHRSSPRPKNTQSPGDSFNTW